MKTRTTALLATLFSTLMLGAAFPVQADGRHHDDRDSRHERGWEDRNDHGRHDGWDRHKWQSHRDYRPVFVYGPPVYYPAPVYYETRTYRYNSSPSLIIDLPTIVIR